MCPLSKKRLPWSLGSQVLSRGLQALCFQGLPSQTWYRGFTAKCVHQFWHYTKRSLFSTVILYCHSIWHQKARECIAVFKIHVYYDYYTWKYKCFFAGGTERKYKTWSNYSVVSHHYHYLFPDWTLFLCS